MNNLVSYLKNVQGELQHVVWPTPKVAAIHTGLVILISAFAAVFIGLLDYGFTSLVGMIVAN